MTIPAGATHVRIGVDEDVITRRAPTSTSASVCRGATLVASSADGDSNEEVNFTAATAPLAADYTVYVHGFDTGSATSATSRCSSGLGTADAGNMTVDGTRRATSIGGTETVTLTFTGLAAGTRYLGVVRVQRRRRTSIGSTIVRVNTP